MFFFFKAVALSTRVAVFHGVRRLLLSPPTSQECVCTGTVQEAGCLLHPGGYRVSRINCLDEQKGDRILYKSTYFLSCTEIIPERYLTAPEGLSGARQLETHCRDCSDSAELLPGFFLRVFF